MLGAEGVGVAGKTFRAIEGDALFGRGRRVRIVAGGAGHFVAGFEFADALPERFGLAERANLLGFLINVNEVVNVVAQIFAGVIVGELAVRLLDGDVAFEVALHADVVATRGGELGWIDDFAFAGGDVGRIVAVAAFAGDAVVCEERHVVFVFGVGDGSSRGTGVAIEAAGIRREIHRHEFGVPEGRGGVPDLFLGVPVDGGFEEEAVEGKKIGAAAVAGADEVLQTARTVHGGVVGAVEGEHGGVVFGIDAVVDAGGSVSEVGGRELVDGGATGAGHGGLGVGGGEIGVAFGAGFVAGSSGGRRFFGGGRRRRFCGGGRLLCGLRFARLLGGKRERETRYSED